MAETKPDSKPESKPARKPAPAAAAAPAIPAPAIPAPVVATPAIPAPALAGTATSERPIGKPKPAKGGWWWGVGRRKTAVARVRLRPAKGGEGKVMVHSSKNPKFEGYKSIEQYFAEVRDRTDALSPLKLTSTLGKLDVFVRLDGGGFMGQAQALKLGLARALKDYDPAVEPALRDQGMLTRDSRDVERKKYGQAGARRRFQFSKR